MQKILITYYSESGSTEEIAKIILNTITNYDVDLLEVGKVQHLNYDGIFIGTPNIYGKPAPEIIKFLKKNNDRLATKSIHLFFTCMACYLDNEMKNYQLEIFTDSNIAKNINVLERMNSWEKSHAVSTYLSNLNIIAPKLTIASIAFFKGRLRFRSLSFINSLIMRMICLINRNVEQGDFYKPQDVETWTKQIDFFFAELLIGTILQNNKY
jgi:menaquinone-dependent protoporphyrinogen IX oxidase